MLIDCIYQREEKDMYSNWEIENQNIFNMLQEYEYISFDIFDTLIFRTVEKPEHIFHLVNAQYIKKHGEAVSDFSKKRIEAEIEARKDNCWNEITIDQIYSKLPYDEVICNRLKNMEKEIEIKNCIPNERMIEIVKKCNQIGKIVVIISDMYLDRYTIDGILKKSSVEYKKLYISSEIGQTKAQGDLFKYVLDDMNIRCEKIIHIGDNLISDVENPRKYGISSMERIEGELFNPIHNKKRNKKSIEKEQIHCFLDRSFQNQNGVSSDFNIGFGVIGPMIFEFCQWLHDKVLENKIDKLFFVAREGYFIKKCYEELYPEEAEKITYFYLNKNLLRLPLLNFDEPNKQFLKSVPHFENFQWKDIFNYLGIENHDEIIKTILIEIEDFVFGEEIKWQDIFDGRYNNVFRFLQNKIKQRVDEQTCFLIQYLEQVQIRGKNIGLVNNSINGNGQSMLQEFIKAYGIDCNVTGFQFIKSKECGKKLQDNCYAWITDNMKNGYYTYLFNQSALIFEHLLFENSGTALKYRKAELQIEVECQEQRLEKYNGAVIDKIQEYGLQFVKSFSNIVDFRIGIDAIFPFFELYLKPRHEDASLICGLYNDDVEGDRKLVDDNLELSNVIILKNRIPRDVSWVQGYISLKQKSQLFLNVYNVKNYLRYFKREVKEKISNIKMNL